MAIESNTRTTTSNIVPACICKGRRGMGAKMVIVASDSRDVQDWVYRYLEPYGLKGYAFYLVEGEEVFSEYVGKIDTVMAFVEDIFFGEKTVGMLDNIRKQYPKLKLALFSASVLPLGVAVRYLYWSKGSYLSLRDSEREIKEAVEAIFGKRQAVPSYLKGFLDEYGRLPDKKPHLTHREVEIVRCAGEGRTGKETASVLMLSRRTVQNHISSIYQKFGIRNMVGVLKLAVSKGILPVEELMSFRV
jgi:DNA-binding CsgD family transcriptional regulator